MNRDLQNAFEKEIALAAGYYTASDLGRSFYHLERAHILGQRFYFPHVRSHWWMLKIGWKRSDRRELLGQIMRILASLGSLLGWVPEGNTGGANVSALTPMPIPEDLAVLLEKEQAPSFWRATVRFSGFLAGILAVLVLVRELI